VDTHVARIAAYIGLTRRRSRGWRMTEEITESLRLLDPEDPVRYDFALCRLGILDACPKRRDPIKCAACPLLPVCRL
jgi:endonuclease III